MLHQTTDAEMNFTKKVVNEISFESSPFLFYTFSVSFKKLD